MMTNVLFGKVSISTYEQWLLLILFLSLISTVMAESRLKLDFPDEFYIQGLADKKFDRRNEVSENTGEMTRKWYRSSDKPENKSRWKNVELYIDTQEERRKNSSDELHDRFSTHHMELDPQFEIRF